MLVNLTVYFHRAGGNSFTNGISSFAHVGAGIFAISVQDVQSNVTEVISCLESVTLLYRPAVAVPFNAHGRVVDRGQRCFQVYGLALSNLCILKGLAELWLLSNEALIADHFFVSAVIFKVLYFLEGALMLSVPNDRFLG